VLTDILGQPPYWLADSIPKFDPSDQLMDESSAWLRLAILGAVTLGAAALAVLRPSTHARTTLALWGPVLLAIAWWAASTIPSTSFGVAPQNYRWVWPIGAFVTLSVASALTQVLATRVSDLRPAVAGTVVAGTALAMLPNMATVHRDGELRAEDAVVGVAGELRSELADSLAQLELDEAVVFDRSLERTFSSYSYPVMAELQRQGVAFGFDNEVDGERFGDRRRLDAEQASGMRRLYLVTGRNLDRVSDELLELATASAVTPADDARRIELDRRLVGALADGQLIVDVRPARYVFGERVDPVVAVLNGERPGRDRIYDVARMMSGLRDYDLLSGPQELLDASDEWVVLHRANELDRVGIFLDA
jgi:hypothetical protein